MRIRTDGKFAHRKDTIQATAGALERNKTDAVLDACRHLVADRDAKRELAGYLADQVRDGDLDPQQAARICEILADPRDIQFAPTVDVDVAAGLTDAE